MIAPIDPYVAQVDAARAALKQRPDGCEGEGQCHGARQWCDACGDVSHVCTDAQNCACHRPATDEQIDELILATLDIYGRGGRNETEIDDSVGSTWAGSGAPIEQARTRARLRYLLDDGAIEVAPPIEATRLMVQLIGPERIAERNASVRYRLKEAS